MVVPSLPSLGLALILGLLVEQGAIPLPEFGFVSAHYGLALALALQSELGPWWAALVQALCLTGRILRQDQGSLEARLGTILCDAAPTWFTAVLFLGFQSLPVFYWQGQPFILPIQGLVSLQLSLALAWRLTPMVAARLLPRGERRDRWEAGWSGAFLNLALLGVWGLGTGVAMSYSWWHLLWALPVLALLHRQAEHDTSGPGSDLSRLLQSRVWRLEGGLKRAQLDLEIKTYQSQAMERQVRDLDSLLNLSQGLAGSLTPNAQVERLGYWLVRLVDHDRRLMWMENQGILWDSRPADDQEAMQELAAWVMSRAQPVLVESLATSRYTPLARHQASLLAVPWWIEEGRGALVVSSRREGAFTPREQFLLGLVAFQAANAMRKAELHLQTLDALQQLRQSKAQLVETSKMAAVGQLAAGMAHEINTPLCAALLTLEMAGMHLKAGKAEAVPGALEKARSDLERIRSIVDKLFFYSRDAKAGRVSVDLGQLVRDTQPMLEETLRQQGVDLHLNLEPVPPVEANQNELQQVLINLLLNAGDAVQETGEPGWVQISVSGDERGVELEVTDTGVGVAPDIRPRIFEPFFTSKPVGSGAGLGLSVSLEIARSHGGTLEYREATGGGAAFTLRLPVMST